MSFGSACRCASQQISNRVQMAKLRGLGALGDNYSATSAADCSSDEMWVEDVGCVTKGSPGGSGSSVWGFLSGGSGGSSGTSQASQSGGSGSIWNSIIQGAAQVGSAAVTGQNPFAPKPTTGKSFFSGATPWIIGGGLVALLLLRRRSS